MRTVTNLIALSLFVVARVVPNALDVRPKTASLNALGTTRSTNERGA